jgi:hypothetical protein
MYAVVIDNYEDDIERLSIWLETYEEAQDFMESLKGERYKGAYIICKMGEVK